jgi:glucose-1-phosphate thymidylyltransferase
MKGIVLAGGSATRLYPVTNVFSKQLLAVYDKPMIYYPLSVLMLAGIREILIISTPRDLPFFKNMLGDGAQWGINITFEEQPQPKGLAQAFIIGKKFIAKSNVCMILGDNIFYGQGFQKLLLEARKLKKGGYIFGYWVTDPERYGVVEFDDSLNVTAIEEKPKNPKTNYVIPGLYFYDNDVMAIAEKITPSDRGELEITDINKAYLERGDLKIKLLGRGFAWFDTGTHDSLLDASDFVATIEKRQGLKIACLEEVAYRMGYIDKHQVKKIAQGMMKSGYGQYLLNMLSYGVRGVKMLKTY